MKRIDAKTAAARLQTEESITILLHQNPDGDAVGCGFALCRALRALGKRVRVLCEDEIPADFAFAHADCRQTELDPAAFVVSVDLADEQLLGAHMQPRFAGKIRLAIDHHPSHKFFAEEVYLEEDSAACAEQVMQVIDALGVAFTPQIAACIYAGISTDTGCFRQANTTARTHRCAARCMDAGVETEPLDRRFFETKSKSYVLLERLALETMRFLCDGKICVLYVTQEMFRASGSNAYEYTKIVPQTVQIEGVLVGVSLREKEDGSFRLNLRSRAPLNVSRIAEKMGGGGHVLAAGCTSTKDLSATIEEVVGHTVQALREAGLCTP